MKRVTQGGDINFDTTSVRGLGQTYTIKFYTINVNNFIMKTNSDVVNGIIALNWTELEALGGGVVNYTVDDNTVDPEYSDGIYNNTFGGTTDYYIDMPVSEGGGDDVDTLTMRLNSEITRSIAKDNELSVAIVDEATARENADIELSAAIVDETTARESADAVLSVRINNNSTAISNTYTKQEVNDLLKEIDVDLPENIVVDSNYVHTDNNFTTNYRNKLDGIATGAEVNVQSDWNVTNTGSDAYIKNKPTKVSAFTNDVGYLTSYSETDPTVPKWAKQSTKPTYTASEVGALPDSTIIPSKTSDLTNDSGFVTDANYTHTDNNYTTTEKNKLADIANGAEVNVQSNWNETNTNSDAYIQNKPTIPTKTSDLTNDSNFIDATNNANVINATSVKIFDGIDNYVTITGDYDIYFECNTLKFTDLYTGNNSLFSMAPEGYALNLGVKKNNLSSLPSAVDGIVTIELTCGYTILPRAFWRTANVNFTVKLPNYSRVVVPEYYVFIPYKGAATTLKTITYDMASEYINSVMWKDGMTPDLITEATNDKTINFLMVFRQIAESTILGEVIKYK